MLGGQVHLAIVRRYEWFVETALLRLEVQYPGDRFLDHLFIDEHIVLPFLKGSLVQDLRTERGQPDRRLVVVAEHSEATVRSLVAQLFLIHGAKVIERFALQSYVLLYADRSHVEQHVHIVGKVEHILLGGGVRFAQDVAGIHWQRRKSGTHHIAHHTDRDFVRAEHIASLTLVGYDRRIGEIRVQVLDQLSALRQVDHGGCVQVLRHAVRLDGHVSAGQLLGGLRFGGHTDLNYAQPLRHDRHVDHYRLAWLDEHQMLMFAERGARIVGGHDAVFFDMYKFVVRRTVQYDHHLDVHRHVVEQIDAYADLFADYAD